MHRFNEIDKVMKVETMHLPWKMRRAREWWMRDSQSQRQNEGKFSNEYNKCHTDLGPLDSHSPFGERESEIHGGTVLIQNHFF